MSEFKNKLKSIKYWLSVILISCLCVILLIIAGLNFKNGINITNNNKIITAKELMENVCKDINDLVSFKIDNKTGGSDMLKNTFTANKGEFFIKYEKTLSDNTKNTAFSKFISEVIFNNVVKGYEVLNSENSICKEYKNSWFNDNRFSKELENSLMKEVSAARLIILSYVTIENIVNITNKDVSLSEATMICVISLWNENLIVSNENVPFTTNYSDSLREDLNVAGSCKGVSKREILKMISPYLKGITATKDNTDYLLDLWSADISFKKDQRLEFKNKYLKVTETGGDI